MILFLVVYFFSGLSHIATSFDSRWTVYIAMSMWNHRDTNLDEYGAALHKNALYALECVDAQGHVRTGPPESCDGHWYDSYPIGGTVLTTPLIVAAVDVTESVPARYWRTFIPRSRSSQDSCAPITTSRIH